MVIAVEQTVAKVGKLLRTNSLCVGASLGGAEPKSAIFRRFVRANNELHERAKGGGGGGGGNEVGNRETSRGRGPEAACLFRPRKFDPLFSYLIYHAPFPSNTGKCPPRPCAEIRVEISGQFYKFFFISQKTWSFGKVSRNYFRWKFLSFYISLEYFFLLLLLAIERMQKVVRMRKLANEAWYDDFIFRVYRWPTIPLEVLKFLYPSHESYLFFDIYRIRWHCLYWSGSRCV